MNIVHQRVTALDGIGQGDLAHGLIGGGLGQAQVGLGVEHVDLATLKGVSYEKELDEKSSTLTLSISKEGSTAAKAKPAADPVDRLFQLQ